MVTNQVEVGQKIRIRIMVNYLQEVLTQGTIGYMIQNMQGANVAGYNIYNSGKLLP